MNTATGMTRPSVLAAGAALATTPLARLAGAAQHGSAFPADFLWGTATAGHQVEGNNVASDLWLLEHLDPTPLAESSGDACNSFELWRTDLDIVRELGPTLFARFCERATRDLVVALDDIEPLVAGMLAGHRAGRDAIKSVRPDLKVGLTLAIVNDQAVGPNSIRDQKRKEIHGECFTAAAGDDDIGCRTTRASSGMTKVDCRRPTMPCSIRWA